MTRMTVTCDRCGEVVEGLEGDGWTSGFYRRDDRWAQYMNDNEAVLCDRCMPDDPRYIADYGVNKPNGEDADKKPA